MIINKENILTYWRIIKNSNPRMEIFKYISRRIIGKKEFFDRDIIIREDKLIFDCGEIMENCKVICEERERGVSFNIDEGVFIDIGAHIGKYTINEAKKENVKVISIEPNKKSFDLLETNIHLNNIRDKVTTFNTALADEEKTLTYFENKDHPATNSLVYSEGKEGKEMKCSTLDILCSGTKNIKMIKIDVEGAELLVLKGAKKILSEQNPKIHFESWTLEQAKEIENYLKFLGYGDMKRINEYDYFIEKKK